jgi:hypothetical protein
MKHFSRTFFGTRTTSLVQAAFVTALLSSCDLGPIVPTGNAKWGFIDKQGTVVIAPRYDDVAEDLHGGENSLGRKFHNFSEGLAAVKMAGKWGYIDKTGKVVVKPQFDLAGAFSEGLACVALGKKYGYINQSGSLAIPFNYDWPAQQSLDAMEFSDGLACAAIKNRFGYMNHSGEIVIPCHFVDAVPFSQGIARVRLQEDVTDVASERRRDSYIDKNGKVLFKYFTADVRCSEDTVVVSEGSGKWLFVDKAGNKLFKRTFFNAQRFSDGLAAVSTSLEHAHEFWGPEYGYMNKSGTIVIPPRFHIPGIWSHNFIDGRALAADVDSGGGANWKAKCGIIDNQGKWIVKPKYPFIASYCEGLAMFHSKNRGCGFLDRKGEVVIEPRFPRANSFSDGLAAVWVE